MRGEASRIADRESRDSLAPKLRDTREDAWRIGNELFTITKVLDDSIQLELALTDPSLEPCARHRQRSGRLRRGRHDVLRGRH